MLNHNILITLSYQLYMIFNDNILDILKVFQRNKTPETLGVNQLKEKLQRYIIYTIYMKALSSEINQNCLPCL